MSSKTQTLSREKAISMLWAAGDLSWKLKGCQVEIRRNILESTDKIQVIVAGRRTGKSYTLCLMALELCLQRPNVIVKYACPKQRMVSTIIRPIIREILEDCPEHLKPDWKTAEKVYVFKNGSEIHIAGTDNESAESLRGTAADFAILDESGFMSQLGYLVRSILSPTLKTRGGKMILASTPSKSANHEFMEKFFLPMQAEGKVKIYTIHDNPNFSDEIKAEIVREYPLGNKDPEYLREYMCIATDLAENAILPSFNGIAQAEIVSDTFEMPTFCDRYCAMDIGGSDLTVILFGYYDFLNATLVIQDEIIADGSTNTAILAELIKEKEALHWTNSIDKTVEVPYKRVADNNNHILLTDLQKLHNLSFLKTKKDKREAAINALDVAILQRKLIINPRCTHLLYAMKFAEWNLSRSDFKKLKDSPTGKIRGGHADALAALIYMHRNISTSRNPFPANYGSLSGSNVFTTLHKPVEDKSTPKSIFAHLFKKK